MIDLVNQTVSSEMLNALLDFYNGSIRKDVILIIDGTTQNINPLAQFYRFEIVPSETRETRFDPEMKINTAL